MTDLDNKLAEFTDRLLANPQYEKVGDMSKEEKVVSQLHRIISPEVALDSAARRRMTQRLSQEWETTHRSRTRQIVRFRTRQVYALAAAMLVAALIGMTFLLNGGNTSASDMPATVEGVESGALYFVIGFMAAGVLFTALFYWWNSKRQ